MSPQRLRSASFSSGACSGRLRCPICSDGDYARAMPETPLASWKDGPANVNHDDSEREFAYTSGTERSLAKANALGWNVVSMSNDWITVF